MVGQDPAIAVEDHAGADAGLGDDADVPELALPVTVIRTTAGLTLAATAIVADDSSMATGWVVPAFVAGGTLVLVTAGRSSAPVAPRARTVPPDARTADSSETAMSEPPRPRDRPVSGAGLAAVVGTAAGAGSYQRSGVTGGVCSHERAHSERGSGAGVKRSSGAGPSAEAGVVQVSGWSAVRIGRRPEARGSAA